MRNDERWKEVTDDVSVVVGCSWLFSVGLCSQSLTVFSIRINVISSHSSLDFALLSVVLRGKSPYTRLAF